MVRKHSVFRVTAIILLALYLHGAVLSGISFGQTTDCGYDPGQPSLTNARKSFLALNYKCAEQELEAYLKLENISIEDRANAHVLLAEVYYARVRDNDEKRDMVMEQFVAAFQSYREWRGELNIKSPEFMSMMKDAQDLVDQGGTKEVVTPGSAETKTTPPAKVEGKKKPWYTKWWAIGLGVGIVAGVVVLAAGGSDDGGDDSGTGALPDFPDTPKKGKK
nr:hypothetical protein [candidate division Zixibacteria bacterium]